MVTVRTREEGKKKVGHGTIKAQTAAFIDAQIRANSIIYIYICDQPHEKACRVKFFKILFSIEYCSISSPISKTKLFFRNL